MMAIQNLYMLVSNNIYDTGIVNNAMNYMKPKSYVLILENVYDAFS